MTTPLRVCSFESRRQEEMARLIERSGGEPTIAPSMREIPLGENPAALSFAHQLLRGEVDVVTFMTGVGTEGLFATLAEENLADEVRAALKDAVVVARGPKPVAALSKLKIGVDVRAPEPNTWQDLAAELERQQIPLKNRSVAIQEYGEPSGEFYEWLQSRGARVIPVPIYKWALPDDLSPLENAVRTTLQDGFEVLLWTSAQQFTHVLQVAEELGCQRDWLRAANRCVVGSIGPTASGRLREGGLAPDLEPSHPKMAHLVRETLQAAPELLHGKRDR